MATQGPLYPGTVTTEAGPSGDNDWLNASNVGADDGNLAEITAATFDAGDDSFRLKAQNFGFTIPASSTIDGIVVEIERSNAAGAASDNEVQLYNAAGTLVGDNKAAAGDWATALTTATYGSSTDTWNASPDVAMINDADFGVALIANADGANTDIGVDFIRVTIHYTPPAATTFERAVAISGTGAVTTAGQFFSVESRSAAISASGAVTVAGVTVHVRTASVAAGGAVTTAGELVHARSAAVGASGAVTSAGMRELLRAAGLDATGTVQVAGLEILARSVAIDATGAVTVAGTVVPGGGATTHERSAALAAVGAVAASGARDLLRSSTVAASGAVTVTGQVGAQAYLVLTHEGPGTGAAANGHLLRQSGSGPGSGGAASGEPQVLTQEGPTGP